MFRRALSLMGLALLALPATGRAQNIVQNGSFESPNVGCFSDHSNVDHWTSNGGFEIWGSCFGVDYDGSQQLELDVGGNTNIFQDLITTPGSMYTLSFASMNPGGVSFSRVQAYWGDVLALDTGNITSQSTWQVFSTSVSATDATTRLEFRAMGTSDGGGDHLDAVNVTPESTPAPEPASMVLMATGLVALAAARRPRKA